MAAHVAPRDNRRLIVRVLSQQVLQLLLEWARDNGEDLIAVLIFTAVWTANVGHLSPRPALRYADLHDIPPDSLRTPVPAADLPAMICLPRAIVTVYVRELVERGFMEETEAGLLVPQAVLARMNTLESVNTTYARAQRLFGALRDAGLGAEDQPAPNRK